MGRILTSSDIEFAVKGGSVFACGGGGWADHGRELGGLAMAAGKPELVDDRGRAGRRADRDQRRDRRARRS